MHPRLQAKYNDTKSDPLQPIIFYNEYKSGKNEEYLQVRQKYINIIANKTYKHHFA